MTLTGAIWQINYVQWPQYFLASIMMQLWAKVLLFGESFMFSFVPAASWRSSNTSNQRCLKAWGISHTSLTPPGARCCFPDFAVYSTFFSLHLFPPTQVLLDVCTLLHLGLGLNFRISLSLPVDWQRRGFRFQVALMWLKSSGCLRDSIVSNLASHLGCRFLSFAFWLNEFVLPTPPVTRQCVLTNCASSLFPPPPRSL